MHAHGNATPLPTGEVASDVSTAISQASIQPFLDSLKGLNDKSVQHIASDSCGARVLEQLLRNDQLPSNLKTSVLMKLSGQWTQLAMGSSSSHLLEACFDYAVRLILMILVSEVCRDLN